MKKFITLGWMGLLVLVVANASAQSIEGAFGLELREVYEKEVGEIYSVYVADFTPSKPVKPFTKYQLAVVPSTKKICIIAAFAKFDGDDPKFDYWEVKHQHKVLMRVIEKKYNAKFQKGPPFIRYPTGWGWFAWVESRPSLSLYLDLHAWTTYGDYKDKVFHLKKGGRVIIFMSDIIYFGQKHNKLALAYVDENLMRAAIAEKKRKKEEEIRKEEEREESEINVEGL